MALLAISPPSSTEAPQVSVRGFRLIFYLFVLLSAHQIHIGTTDVLFTRHQEKLSVQGKFQSEWLYLLVWPLTLKSTRPPCTRGSVVAFAGEYLCAETQNEDNDQQVIAAAVDNTAKASHFRSTTGTSFHARGRGPTDRL